MSQKKFIIVQSRSVAEKLMACGFQLVSHLYGTYTFINEPPKNFTFDVIDAKQVRFTNHLCL